MLFFVLKNHKKSTQKKILFSTPKKMEFKKTLVLKTILPLLLENTRKSPFILLQKTI